MKACLKPKKYLFFIPHPPPWPATASSSSCISSPSCLLPPASCLLPPTAGGRRQEAGGRRTDFVGGRMAGIASLGRPRQDGWQEGGSQ